MITNDVVEVILNGDYLGKPWQNVFFYRMTVAPANRPTLMNEVAAEFMSDLVVAALLPTLSASCRVLSATTRNLYDDLEIGSVINSPILNGAVAGDGLPAFNTWSFRSQKMPRGVHRASKRFSGVPEASQANGALSGNAGLTLGTLATFLAEEIVYAPGGGATIWRADPTNVRRIEYVTPKGKVAYRLPRNQTEGDDFLITAYEVRGLSTQNSRK